MVALYFAFTMKSIDDPSRYSFILFVFCSTVSVYSLLRLRTVGKIQDPMLRNLSWAAGHIGLARWVMYIAMAGAIITFIFLNNKEQMIVILLGVVWILYNTSVFSKGHIKYDLRSIWYLKPLIVGFIITGIVTWVPYQDACPYSLSTFLFIATILFCFVSALVVVFEIKDRAIDSRFNTDTITTRLGVAHTKIIAISLLAIAIVLVLLSHPTLSMTSNFSYILPLLVLIAFIYFFIHEKTNEYIYWIVIDGWMVILGIIWYILNHHIFYL